MKLMTSKENEAVRAALAVDGGRVRSHSNTCIETRTHIQHNPNPQRSCESRSIEMRSIITFVNCEAFDGSRCVFELSA